MTHDSLVLLKH